MPARLAPSWRHTRGSLPQPSPRTSFSRSCVPDAAPHPGAPASTLGDKNCSPSQRNRRSPSDRNAVRNHNGIVFGFRAESRSPSTGFPNNFRFLPACRFQRILHYSAAPCFLCITNRFRGRPGFSPKRANSRAHAKSRALRLGKSSAISCSGTPFRNSNATCWRGMRVPRKTGSPPRISDEETTRVLFRNAGPPTRDVSSED
jgi:hypothetical protein